MSPLGRLQSIQACRAAAAWLVVAYHTVTILGPRLSTGLVDWPGIALWRAIGFGGVDLFFVISGVVMTAACVDRMGDAGEIVPFLKRRFARIYPLYWAATAAVLALRWAAPTLMDRTATDATFVVKSALLWPQGEFPVVSAGWTLTFELYFYFVFAALMLLPHRRFVAGLTLWAAAVLVGFHQCAEPAVRSLQANLEIPIPFSPLTFEFIAGCAFGWLLTRGVHGGGRTALAAGLAGFCLAGGYFGTTDFEAASYGFTRVSIFGISSAAIVYGLSAMEITGQWSGHRGWAYWGDASYSLYLTHVYVIRAVRALAGWAGAAESLGQSCLLLVVCCAACAMVAAACYRWVERPLLRRARRALGC